MHDVRKRARLRNFLADMDCVEGADRSRQEDERGWWALTHAFTRFFEP